jgi:putative multiple sugar transport system substrate-binding protein
MKKFILLATAILCFTALSFAAPAKQPFVGVSMPTREFERWNFDGKYLQDDLKKKGYKVSLQYAQNEVQNQIAHIEDFITQGADVLIIAAIDDESLTAVLKQAKEKNIKIIAYDRLILNTPNVDYYVTFDNYKVGVMQGEIIVKALGLDKGAKGPFNIEVFAGASDDNNAKYFYDGAWSVIKPYFDKKIITVPSNEFGWPRYATEAWDAQSPKERMLLIYAKQAERDAWSVRNAEERMTHLIARYYNKGQKLDAVLSPNDTVAYGIITALKKAGYKAGDAQKPFPIITGQDCDEVNVKAIFDGEQTASIFKNTKTLADRAVMITQDLIDGKTPEVNDTKTYNNGVKIVPAFLCEPVVVYKADIKKLLIDSGYYKVSDIGLKESDLK